MKSVDGKVCTIRSNIRVSKHNRFEPSNFRAGKRDWRWVALSGISNAGLRALHAEILLSRAVRGRRKPSPNAGD